VHAWRARVNISATRCKRDASTRCPVLQNPHEMAELTVAVFQHGYHCCTAMVSKVVSDDRASLSGFFVTSASLTTLTYYGGHG
jgi:hypothetical protein